MYHRRVKKQEKLHKNKLKKRTSSNGLCWIVQANHGEIIHSFLVVHLNDAGSRDASCIATQLEHIRETVLPDSALYCKAVNTRAMTSVWRQKPKTPNITCAASRTRVQPCLTSYAGEGLADWGPSVLIQTQKKVCRLWCLRWHEPCSHTAAAEAPSTSGGVLHWVWVTPVTQDIEKESGITQMLYLSSYTME